MARTDKNPRPIKLGAKSQMAEGVHATFSDMNEGDVIRPAQERGASGHTSITDESKTYFATTENENMAWDFASNLEEEAGFQGRQTPRIRLLRTAPSQDQELDANYVRGNLQSGMMQAQVTGSRTPVRDAIDHVKSMSPRTSGSQVVKSVEWAPRPVNGQSHVESTLPKINWHQFGGENYTTFKNGQSWTDTGKINSAAALGAPEDEPSAIVQEQKARYRSMPQVPGQGSLEDHGMVVPQKQSFDWEM